MSSISINDLYNIYGSKKAGKIPADDQDALQQGLDSIKQISCKEEAHKFLQLLALLRQAESRTIAGLGENAMATITGAFAGGDEGVYSADTDLMNARFIFELVQNVDDCKYQDVTNCNLRIQFDTQNDTIRLAYNELGFQPENVIAITGIGNSTKNHKKAENLNAESKMDQNDLQEIGEKGIGFKSIFGLAKKVKISSQYFCFTIERENFFVPIVEDYDSFSYIPGTILELTLDDGMVGELYGFLKKKYGNVSAIINENPILFLNKLTEITYYRSNNDYFGFRVSRSNQAGDYYEDETKIEFFSSAQSDNRIIDAYRFTQSIEYSIEECRARYGEEEAKTRKHNIIVIAPKNPNMIHTGRIYSFFATSEKINAPFIIHAPFKLNSGRTKIDSQSQRFTSHNKWFLKTKKETTRMIRLVYERLAEIQGNNIRFYIPDYNLVDADCAICSGDLSKSNILTWNIFEAMDGEHYPARLMCTLSYDGTAEQLKKIHQLLQITKLLLNVKPEEVVNFRDFGIIDIGNVQDKLLRKALEDECYTQDCLSLIHDYSPQFKLLTVAPSGITLSYQQVKEISKFQKLTAWLNTQNFDYIRPSKLNGSMISYQRTEPGKDISIIKNFCAEYGDAINKTFMDYLDRVEYYGSGFTHTVYTYNAIFGNNIMEDFAEAYREIEPKDKYFYPFLRVEAVSEEIDRLCENGDRLSDFEFLKALEVHRKNQKNMLKDQYKSILDLIQKSGTNTERFFPEILQNIDDCLYNSTPSAVFRIERGRDNQFKLYVSYNELGFTRDQIRAITAIGDSTKKRLLSSHTTGEKGIGFKSVFALCDSVSITSGNFCFRLSDEKPTVPEAIREIEYHKGTEMVFILKPGFSQQVLNLLSDDKKVIENCLCLKQLHSLFIQQKELKIFDKDNNRRVVNYGEKQFEYFCYKLPIKVDNHIALYQRRKNKDVLTYQEIHYLVPLFNTAENGFRTSGVYSTFPTNEKINIPMIVNMPLELDTARERIQEGEWNRTIIQQMINGLPDVYNSLKYLFKEELPMMFPADEWVLQHKYGYSSLIIQNLAVKSLFKLAFSNDYVSLVRGEFTYDFEYKILSAYGEFIAVDTSHILAKSLNSYERLKKIYGKQIKERNLYQVCRAIDSLLQNAKKQEKDVIKDKDFRNSLYEFLAIAPIVGGQEGSMLRTWAIIPITYKKEIMFVPYSEDIYAPGEGNIDSETYKILDKKTMSAETFNKIFQNITGSYRPIPKFSKDIIIAQFFKTVVSILNDQNLSQRAEKILSLFKSEKDLFTSTVNSRNDFPVDKIMFAMSTGTIRNREGSYLCEEKKSQGCLDDILVDEKYTELAKLLKVKKVEEITSYRQIPFEIGRKELHDLSQNKYLTQKSLIFSSLYQYEGRSSELKNGLGFFELYTLTPVKVRCSKEQSSKYIGINEEILQSYAEVINDISISEVPISFSLNTSLFEFEKDNILGEIEDELQVRKENDKIRKILSMLANCSYASLLRREPCCVRGKSGLTLLIDTKITADYDIIETLKQYFLKYFNTELAVNRNIRLYNRRGFENISTIESDSAAVADATRLMSGINMLISEEVKDFACRPLTIKDITYGGYAKTCPLCGARINTELTGMRIYKTKCQGKIIPLISCTNCHENMRYSSDIRIDIDKLESGILDMDCEINGFVWSVKDIIIRLGHRAIIKKMNSK